MEHFGLGRYGDPINVNGHILGLKHIADFIREQGKLYLSVPIGDTKVEFNGQRVFSIEYITHLIEKDFSIDEFSFVNDKGELQRDVTLNDRVKSTNAGCKYGCGIFEATKKKA